MTDTASSPVEIRGISREKAPEPPLGTDPIILGHRYTSPEFAQREWDHMWTRVWQVAGRVDQIPEAGDYVNYEIGHESIIAVRGDDTKIRAFYNVCQHRGNQLVNAEVGTLAGGEFQCAYHGWRFDTTGECTWVYDEDDFPQGTPCGSRNLGESQSRNGAAPGSMLNQMKPPQVSQGISTRFRLPHGVPCGKSSSS